MHAKSSSTQYHFMHSLLFAIQGDRTLRSPGKNAHILRHTAVALAVAGAMPVWAQNTMSEVRGPVETQIVPFENSRGIMGNGLDLQGLNTNNSNLPLTSPRVLNAQIGENNYAENAKVGLIRVSVAQNSLPADGQTPARLAIQLLDVNGKPLKGDAFVTVEATAGRIQIPGAATDETGPGSVDTDRITRGTQVKVVNGKAEVLLLAPFQPQDVTVRITAGRAQAQGIISFVPELREMLAVGLVEGIIKFDSKSPLQLTDARRDDGFEREIRSFSSSSSDGRRYSAMRTAFFLKGKIKGDALLTMAYDSDKDTYDRLFRSIRPDDYYAVYGDSSVRGFEAQSTSKLYVRIDKDRSYMLFGDFNTGDGFSQVSGGGNVASVRKRDLGNYSRTMNGVRGHYDENGFLLNGFVTKDSLLQLVEEFPGQGISGPFAVSKRDAVAGTEKVEIITRDRYQPAVILSVETLQRAGDYSFEPFSGRILLNQPLSSVDVNGNPKSLRVTYEVESNGEKFWVYGVDGQVRLGERAEVGGAYVKDKNPYAPYTLTSANVSFNPTDKTTIVAEVARSQSVLGNGLGTSLNGNPYSLQPQFGPAPSLGNLEEIEGSAWRVEALHNDDTVQARFFYGRSDPYFNNPSASLAQGREEGALKVTKRLGEQWAIYAEATHSAHQTAGASRDSLAFGAVHEVTDRLSVDLALTHTDEKAGEYANALMSSGSGLVVDPSPGIGFGYGSSLINSQTGYGYNGTNYGLAGVDYNTTGVRIRGNYRATDKIDLFSEYEHGIDGDSYQRAAVGAAYRFSEVGRVYGKYEWMSGLSAPQANNGIYDSNAFVFGADTQYLPNQRVFSEYRLRDSIGGDQLQSASGLRNGWNLSETVKVATTAEYLRVYRGQAQDAYALTGAVEWRPDDLWLLSNRLEWRRLKDKAGEGAAAPALAGNDTWLSVVSVARKINRDWTFLGRNYLLTTDNRGHGGNLHEDKLQLGAAYRDTDTNRLNVLARYEYWTQRDRSGLNYPANRSAYGSDGSAYYPGDPYSSNNEGFDKHIVSVHAEYHPSRPWWFGGRAAAKSQRDYFDGRSDAYRAYLLGGRVTYDISKRWDISGLASVLYSPQGRATQHALGMEAGYQVQDNLWVSAGYNWRGFRDRDLTGSDYTNQGFYVRVRFKFDENLFAGSDKVRNPTLDR